MSRGYLVALTSAAILMTTCVRAYSYPTKWSSKVGGNNHWYEAIAGSVDWDGAVAGAISHGGHLVTITSAAENAWVFDLVRNRPELWLPDGWNGPWLGGYQPAGSPEPAGGWTWVNGDAWGYANWWPSQPDDAGGQEDHLQFHGPNRNTATWNDQPRTKGLGGYVVEYDTDPRDFEFAGHSYEVVIADVDWAGALAGAGARGGHLATITSAAENAFVFSLIRGDSDLWLADGWNGPWIGGFQPPGSPEPAGNWRWVLPCEDFSYSNWWPSQPDNAGGVEHHLQFHGPDRNSATWNDQPATRVLAGYILEFSNPCPTPVTPLTWSQIKVRHR